VWILLATLALMAINYSLVYNKMHYCVDLGLLIYLGVFTFPDYLRHNGSSAAKPLLDCFFLMLIFASMRVINRHELKELFLYRKIDGNKGLFIVSTVCALTLWCTVIALPRPMMVAGLTFTKSNLKNIGTALEMYSSDHRGLYPRELSAITPDYLKRLPELNLYSDDKNTEYYMKKYGISRGYMYQVNAGATDYTVRVDVPSYDLKGTPFRVLYTSKEGLVENYK
jgi:hypothetical protein